MDLGHQKRQMSLSENFIMDTMDTMILQYTTVTPCYTLQMAIFHREHMAIHRWSTMGYPIFRPRSDQPVLEQRAIENGPVGIVDLAIRICDVP